jgi:aryl-alcohol dehydrogenase-like predicted oxidoreductase
MPEGARLTVTQRFADRYLSDGNWRIVEQLGDYAASRGHSMLELAFSWLVNKSPVTSVIAGATRPEQVEQNVRAASWAMTAEDMAAIDKITKR